MTEYNGDLQFWASSLREFQGARPGVTTSPAPPVLTLDADQPGSEIVALYVHELAGEMGDHLESIADSLVIFVDVGA